MVLTTSYTCLALQAIGYILNRAGERVSSEGGEVRCNRDFTFQERPRRDRRGLSFSQRTEFPIMAKEGASCNTRSFFGGWRSRSRLRSPPATHNVQRRTR